MFTDDQKIVVVTNFINNAESDLFSQQTQLVGANAQLSVVTTDNDKNNAQMQIDTFNQNIKILQAKLAAWNKELDGLTPSTSSTPTQNA